MGSNALFQFYGFKVIAPTTKGQTLTFRNEKGVVNNGSENRVSIFDTPSLVNTGFRNDISLTNGNYLWNEGSDNIFRIDGLNTVNGTNPQIKMLGINNTLLGRTGDAPVRIDIDGYGQTVGSASTAFQTGNGNDVLTINEYPRLSPNPMQGYLNPTVINGPQVHANLGGGSDHVEIGKANSPIYKPQSPFEQMTGKPREIIGVTDPSDLIPDGALIKIDAGENQNDSDLLEIWGRQEDFNIENIDNLTRMTHKTNNSVIEASNFEQIKFKENVFNPDTKQVETKETLYTPPGASVTSNNTTPIALPTTPPRNLGGERVPPPTRDALPTRGIAAPVENRSEAAPEAEAENPPADPPPLESPPVQEITDVVNDAQMTMETRFRDNDEAMV